MQCNKCGRELPDNVGFCSSCGNRISVDAPFAPPPVAEPKKSNMALIVVIIVVVIVAVAGIGTYLVIRAGQEAVNDIGNNDVDLTVTGTSVIPDGSWPPASGNRYMQLTIHLVNNEDHLITVSLMDFELKTSDGVRHDPTTAVDDTVPGLVMMGGSTTFTVCFEIPITATPQTLIFHPLLSAEIEAPVP